MAVAEIKLRVTALEAEVARLKERVENAFPSRGDWLDEIFGVFDNDPIYEEAMRLGREYRESSQSAPETDSQDREVGCEEIRESAPALREHALDQRASMEDQVHGL